MDEMKFWGAATVGSKGQIVIPIEAREALNVHEGDKVLILSAPGNAGFMAVKPEIVEAHVQKLSNGIAIALTSREEVN